MSKMNSNKEMTAHPPLPLGKESTSAISSSTHPDSSLNPRESTDSHHASSSASTTKKLGGDSTHLFGAISSTSTMPSGGIPIGHPSNQIIIHVCDEAKKRNQDFKCDRTILVANMKYFEKYLSDNKNLEDIDISVHCDINIFDWLMRYIHKKDTKLEIKNAISILISSDFLQMAHLVEDSVRFVAVNIHEIIGLPIDMNCLNSNLVKKLAEHIQIEDLNNMKDKKDKLQSKLFMKKLELMFEDEQSMLHRCAYCNSLFTQAQREWMMCPKAKIFIDFHGTVIA